MDALSITVERADTPAVAALLTRHHALMRAGSPEESCHVMDVSELVAADVTLLAARQGDQLLGVGALKVIGADHGELKSMHTAQEARGKGVARAILNVLQDKAQEQGLSRLSLETGTADMFAPARALYHAEGFQVCPAFGGYVADPLSVFMTRTL
ncbi:GNAT family N-acetyltransferase [Ascidiaceihabitans sp.]|uniref:GNAT family N-acetyltransferase n=1 Tax=Ascidiaceihabitans sp. TaxID=1872644 RepID=UPI003296F6D7